MMWLPMVRQGVTASLPPPYSSEDGGSVVMARAHGQGHQSGRKDGQGSGCEGVDMSNGLAPGTCWCLLPGRQQVLTIVHVVLNIIFP